MKVVARWVFVGFILIVGIISRVIAPNSTKPSGMMKKSWYKQFITQKNETNLT